MRAQKLRARNSLTVRSSAISAFRGEAENICSQRAFPVLTLMYGPAARCKRFSSSCRFAVLHQCIRPLIGAFAPGHHGYQRACVLISGQASSGAIRVTSVRMRREDRSSISSYSSRRPRLETVDRVMSSLAPHFAQFLCSSQGPFLRPDLQNVDRAARRGGQGRPSRLACGWLRRCQAAP